MLKIFDKILFSIGAMKAGTSWVFELLKDHPEIDTVPIKEVHYFWDRYGTFRLLTREQRIVTTLVHLNHLLPNCSPVKTPALLSWFERYLSDRVDDVWFGNLFSGRTETRICAEFSNMNAVLPNEGWDHIRSIAHTVRILYTIRNPVERMWSHTRFHAQIIGKSDELQSWDSTQFRGFIEESGVSAHSAYSTIIRSLRANFSADEHLVLFFDDIKKQPIQFLRRVETFLGIHNRDYAAHELTSVHNQTPPMTMPASFLDAVESQVASELDKIRELNPNVPVDWSIRECRLCRHDIYSYYSAN
jgi:hypothetical protein